MCDTNSKVPVEILPVPVTHTHTHIHIHNAVFPGGSFALKKNQHNRPSGTCATCVTATLHDRDIGATSLLRPEGIKTDHIKASFEFTVTRLWRV